ncbi:adapter molecule Crk-like protein [Dinothrombium tinctorium]|uniref:Adapter molecule Crk-like protein n=1 Tax=Dinothrombium tinctorium TaxID=1965070 RepID=A0A3S4QUX1_9ACAR|nr:adapter molecule Crk-like protein [Dinothrombium tinctorium]
MAASFDPYDRNSWYFGPMSRQEATNILMNEQETGVFLVRNSATIRGDLVLCVREENKVSHYIINRVQQGDQTRFRIGDQIFPDLPALLSFYKIYYLDSAPLARPATKRVEKVRGKFAFSGKDVDDLPFKKGEILTVISKDEDQWWTARNSLGQIGSIPVPYVELFDESQAPASQPLDFNDRPPSNPQLASSQNNSRPAPAEPIRQYHTPNIQRKLPALAKVKQARVPNAYDETALKLQVGDIIKVTEININGQWKGELNGKIGHFPFTHVEFIDSENGEEEEAA